MTEPPIRLPDDILDLEDRLTEHMARAPRGAMRAYGFGHYRRRILRAYAAHGLPEPASMAHAYRRRRERLGDPTARLH
jgi:hypothetical protein